MTLLSIQNFCFEQNKLYTVNPKNIHNVCMESIIWMVKKHQLIQTFMNQSNIVHRKHSDNLSRQTKKALFLLIINGEWEREKDLTREY